MATAPSSQIARAWAIGAATLLVGVVVASQLPLAAGSSRPRAAHGGTRSAAAAPPAGLGWLTPQTAPTGWRATTTASGGATLFYPPAWALVPGDHGTVSAALRDDSGRYAGYLNVTPGEGAERLRGWARFRIEHNREEGATGVQRSAAAEGLSFRNARGSCVIDDYVSRVRSHPYREIACIITGHRNTAVLVGAALVRDWPALGKTIQQAASAFVVR